MRLEAGFIVCILLASTAGDATKLAVLPVQALAGAKEKLPREILNDTVVTAAADSSGYEVVGQDDIHALISFDQQKNLLGCDDVQCFAEIGGALGVEVLMQVRVGLINDEWIITSKVINIQLAKAVKRSTDFVVGDSKALLKAIPHVVAKLFGKTASTPAVFTTTAAEPTAAVLTAAVQQGYQYTLKDFRVAGLGLGDFSRYKRSFNSYEQWAAQKNKESVTLEIFKWILTGNGAVTMVLGIGLWEFDDELGAFVFFAGLASMLPLWIIDIINIGTVPAYIDGSGSNVAFGILPSRNGVSANLAVRF